MTGRQKKLVLAELETLVMKEVWKRSRATVHDVRDALKDRRKLAYTTILTTMRNLEKKGFLDHEMDGRSHVYIPKVDEKTVERSTVRLMLDGLFDGSKVRLVNALFEDESLSETEFEKLRKKILELRDPEEHHE